jgi:hypothetical protein
MEKRKLERKKYLKLIIGQRIVRTFLNKVHVILEIDVNFYIKKIQFNVKNNSIEKECHKFIKTRNSFL